MDDLARAVGGRPWLTLVLDVFSRCVLGFYLSFDAPSAAGVALAVGQAVLAKPDWLGERGLDLAWPMHGVPKSLHLDNGKEFHSKALKRGCQQHGIRIDYCPPPSRASVALARGQRQAAAPADRTVRWHHSIDLPRD